MQKGWSRPVSSSWKFEESKRKVVTSVAKMAEIKKPIAALLVVVLAASVKAGGIFNGHVVRTTHHVVYPQHLPGSFPKNPQPAVVTAQSQQQPSQYGPPQYVPPPVVQQQQQQQQQRLVQQYGVPVANYPPPQPLSHPVQVQRPLQLQQQVPLNLVPQPQPQQLLPRGIPLRFGPPVLSYFPQGPHQPVLSTLQYPRGPVGPQGLPGQPISFVLVLPEQAGGNSNGTAGGYPAPGGPEAGGEGQSQGTQGGEERPQNAAGPTSAPAAPAAPVAPVATTSRPRSRSRTSTAAPSRRLTARPAPFVTIMNTAADEDSEEDYVSEEDATTSTTRRPKTSRKKSKTTPKQEVRTTTSSPSVSAQGVNQLQRPAFQGGTAGLEAIGGGPQSLVQSRPQQQQQSGPSSAQQGGSLNGFGGAQQGGYQNGPSSAQQGRPQLSQQASQPQQQQSFGRNQQAQNGYTNPQPFSQQSSNSLANSQLLGGYQENAQDSLALVLSNLIRERTSQQASTAPAPAPTARPSGGYPLNFDLTSDGNAQHQAPAPVYGVPSAPSSPQPSYGPPSGPSGSPISSPLPDAELVRAQLSDPRTVHALASLLEGLRSLIADNPLPPGTAQLSPEQLRALLSQMVSRRAPGSEVAAAVLARMNNEIPSNMSEADKLVRVMEAAALTEPKPSGGYSSSSSESADESEEEAQEDASSSEESQEDEVRGAPASKSIIRGGSLRTAKTRKSATSTTTTTPAPKARKPSRKSKSKRPSASSQAEESMVTSPSGGYTGSSSAGSSAETPSATSGSNDNSIRAQLLQHGIYPQGRLVTFTLQQPSFGLQPLQQVRPIQQQW